MDLSSTTDEAKTAPEGREGRRLPALVAGAAVAVVAVVVAVLLLSKDDAEAPKLRLDEPKIVSADALRAFAESARQPVYWAGERSGERLELTKTRPGNVFVRYLLGGAAAGDPRPKFTTVGTYPVKDAYESIRERGRNAQGTIEEKGPEDARVVIFAKRPTSVYVAYPQSHHLIEVYAPSAPAARRLALSDEISAID